MTGTVQAAPEERSFVILSQRDGRFTVNASKATIRQLGRVVNFDAVKPGQVVTAFGTRTAGQLTAEEVCICPPTPEPGQWRAPQHQPGDHRHGDHARERAKADGQSRRMGSSP